MAKRSLGSILFALVASLGALTAGSCGSGHHDAVSVWIQAADDIDSGGGADGDVWGEVPGTYDLVALSYQRIDSPGPVVGIPIPSPGYLDQNEFVFVGHLPPGIYQFTATYSSGVEVDQALYAGPPPKSSLDTALTSYLSASDPVDLSALGGDEVTLVIQGTL